MIYTIVPIEEILSSPENGTPEERNAPEKRGLRAKYMNEDVLLTQSDTGEYTIDRLLSTNPGSYLRKELFPGSTVDIKAVSFE